MWKCEVISNKNVATFIKEFIVFCRKVKYMDFVPVHTLRLRFLNLKWTHNKDIDKDLIGAEYLPAWEKFGLFGLKCKEYGRNHP